MEELYKKLLDHRNIDLWETLIKSNVISLVESYEPNYITNFYDSNITMYIDHENIDPAYFTHELLHVLIKNKGVDIADAYNDRIVEDETLSLVFTKDLRDHIGNCLEHVKMIPIYLDLGFEPYKFNSDYADKKMDDNFMRLLESKYRTAGGYSAIAVDFFIGKYFGMVACNNKSHNYSKFYSRMNRLDSKLFTLLQNFWDDWSTYDINDPEDDFTEILDIHIDDLANWSKNKRFV